MKEDDGTILTSVYRKKIHIDQYLQFSSHHQIAHKQAVIRTLFTRASRLSSSLIHRSSEECHVVTALQENGYPSCLIQKHRTQGRQRQNNSEKPSARVTLPYIQGMSEAIRRVLGELDIQTAFKPLWNILSYPKDPISQKSRSSVIFLALTVASLMLDRQAEISFKGLENIEELWRTSTRIPAPWRNTLSKKTIGSLGETTLS